MLTDNIEIISIIVAILGSAAIIINSRILAEKRDVYTPAYNKVNENINTLEYNKGTGEFAKIWRSFDSHIQDKIAEDNFHGWLVRFDAKISELNRFLYNFQLNLESVSNSSDYIVELDGRYFFDIGGTRGQVLLDEFINHHGFIFVTTSNKSDLWENLRENSERGYHHTEIKNWGPTDERIDLLWECREET